MKLQSCLYEILDDWYNESENVGDLFVQVGPNPGLPHYSGIITRLEWKNQGGE
jgi:hypothetical protein